MDMGREGRFDAQIIVKIRNMYIFFNLENKYMCSKQINK